jgi:sensor histidine kinase YesM
VLTNRLYYLISSINTEIESLEKRDNAAIIGGDDEFKQINSSFHGLIERIKESYRNNASVESEKRLLEAELQQDLINPHFLYNTLESIKWAAKDKQVTGIIDSMVMYYRTSLNKGDPMLPVRQELDLVEEYIKLQRFAFESDFRYSIECDAEASRCLMLKHLLQPAVENAIIHGIDKKGSVGRIAVSCRRREDMLVFTVEDNGSGISEEKLAGLRSGQSGSSAGFGLGNVRKRLALYYGAEASLLIESDPGSGTRVVICIPCAKPETLCS